MRNKSKLKTHTQRKSKLTTIFCDSSNLKFSMKRPPSLEPRKEARVAWKKDSFKACPFMSEGERKGKGEWDGMGWVERVQLCVVVSGCVWIRVSSLGSNLQGWNGLNSPRHWYWEEHLLVFNPKPHSLTSSLVITVRMLMEKRRWWCVWLALPHCLFNCLWRENVKENVKR